MQALEAADVFLADLPATVVGCVLIALGSSATEREDLARSLAGHPRRTIAEGAAATLAEHGEEGYLAEWVEAPFPAAHLAMIRDHLERLA